MACTASLRRPSSSAAVASRAKSSPRRLSGSWWHSASYDAAHSRRSYASRAWARSSIRPMTCPSRVDHSPPATACRAAICSATYAGIAPDARQDHRGERVLEAQAAEVETGGTLDDAAVLARPAPFVEDRQLDPVEPLLEAGAPDDAGDIEHLPVVEQRPAVSRAGEPGLGPRSTPRASRSASLTRRLGPPWKRTSSISLRPDRGPAGEHVLEDQQDAAATTIRAARDSSRTPQLAGVAAAEDRLVGRRHVVGDILAGVRGPHHEHRAGGQAGTAAGRHWSGAGRCRDRDRPPRPAPTGCGRRSRWRSPPGCS